MGEVIAEFGYESGICGHDGSDWIKVLVDSDGKLQIEVDTSALPEGAATEETLQAVRDRIGALTSPAAGSTNKLLTDALTALQLIDDLRNALGSVDTDDLQVDVKTSALPSGASTEATLADILTAAQLIDDLRAALNSVATDELDVVLDGQNADVEVTQTTPADLVVAQHQYDGSAWRKSNLIWGYHDVWDEDLGGTATEADWYGNTSTIPSGEVWVCQAASIRNSSGPVTVAALYIIRASGANVFLNWAASLAQYEPLVITGNFVLGPGDGLYVYAGGLDVGDTVAAGVVGYKMDIAM